MKKILFLLLLLSLFSCNGIKDFVYGIKISGKELYEYDFGTITGHLDIADWIETNIEYRLESIDSWDGPEETITRGYGDCDDMALLYMNIAYFELGIKMDYIFTNVTANAVINGSPVNHAEVYFNGFVYDIYSGVARENVNIGYLYKFDEVYND